MCVEKEFVASFKSAFCPEDWDEFSCSMGVLCRLVSGSVPLEGFAGFIGSLLSCHCFVLFCFNRIIYIIHTQCSLCIMLSV